MSVTNGNKTCWDWDDGNICWNDNPYDWDDVCLVQEVVDGGGGLPGEGKVTDWNEGYNKLDEPKKKRFITLVGKVKGETDISQLNVISLFLSPTTKIPSVFPNPWRAEMSDE